MVERFGRIEEARGSIPLTSTSIKTTQQLSLLFKVGLGILAVITVITGCTDRGNESRFAGLEVDAPAKMPDLTLTDTAGRPFAMRSDTPGSVRLVYFGFTSCPDICPVHLAQLSDVLARPGMPPNVKVLFVTVDPERDTPKVMRTFLDRFNSEFVGLTGTVDQLLEAQQQFSALVALPSSVGDRDSPLIGHDGRVFAFAPDGMGRTQYPHPTRQTAWTRDLPILATLR